MKIFFKELFEYNKKFTRRLAFISSRIVIFFGFINFTIISSVIVCRNFGLLYDEEIKMLSCDTLCDKCNNKIKK
jgi:hypothetical protein